MSTDVAAGVAPEVDLDRDSLRRMEAAYARAFRCAEGSPGFAFVEEPGLTRIISDVPTPWFNAVLSTRLAPTDQDPAVERLVALYGSRGLPLLWRLGPATTDRAALRGKLRAAGFHAAPPSTAIVGDIPALIHLWEVLPVPVRGIRVADVDGYRRWFGVFSDSFGVPASHRPFFEQVAEQVGFGPEAELQNLVLEKQGAVVACATTMWRPGEPFASIFNFAVAPALRSSGLGKHMLAYAALRLRQQGCRRIGQFSTQVGAPFYLRVTPSRRLGDFENFVWLGVP
jgi:ribosomal protein S18 acetylase RimI-like enzyme